MKKEFWSIFHNIEFIVKRLPKNSNLSLFRSRAPIVWEGITDFIGGFWSSELVQKQENYQNWVNLAVEIVGESFENHEFIVKKL